MTEQFDERVIVRSQAERFPNGAVALILHFDHGLPVAGALDWRTIAGLRRQLDVAERMLAAPGSSAE